MTRWQLTCAQSAVSLVRATYLHDAMALRVRRDQLIAALREVEHVQMLIEIASRSGTISEMNARIISGELNLMHQYLFSQFGALDGGTVYSERDEAIGSLFKEISAPMPMSDIKDTAPIGQSEPTSTTDPVSHSPGPSTRCSRQPRTCRYTHPNHHPAYCRSRTYVYSDTSAKGANTIHYKLSTIH